jgi:hypothetical protein
MLGDAVMMMDFYNIKGIVAFGTLGSHGFTPLRLMVRR